MVDGFRLLHDRSAISLPSFRHWIHGFTLQTLVYGINIVLFLMSIWVLINHILKGSTSHRFHRYHLFQNCILLAYALGMFVLSSIYMGHEGFVVEEAWLSFIRMDYQNPEEVALRVYNDRVSLRRACDAILILVNWGTVALLLWRCVLHYKVRSVFPCETMALPYLLYASSIATGLLRIIKDARPDMLSHATQTRDWALIHWSIATALYYLLSFLIVARVVYHRHIIVRDIGESDIGHFASILTIFYESGALVLAFSTAYLIVLARYPDLMYLIQSTTAQVQVMLSLIIVQRVTVGKAWSGKTVDCILHSEPRQDTRHEEVSTMGFNPNTELSMQNEYTSEHCSDTKGQHDLTFELREVMRSKV